jgi:hypothetical protein
LLQNAMQQGRQAHGFMDTKATTGGQTSAGRGFGIEHDLTARQDEIYLVANVRGI